MKKSVKLCSNNIKTFSIIKVTDKKTEEQIGFINNIKSKDGFKYGNFNINKKFEKYFNDYTISINPITKINNGILTKINLDLEAF